MEFEVRGERGSDRQGLKLLAQRPVRFSVEGPERPFRARFMQKHAAVGEKPGTAVLIVPKHL